MYYVQLTSGLIAKSDVPFTFGSTGSSAWSDNIDVSIGVLNPHDGRINFNSVENFFFKREDAIAYWGQYTYLPNKS